MTLLGEPGYMPRINISSTEPTDLVQVTYRRFRWHLRINGRTLGKFWGRNDAVILANFLARAAAPSTLEISAGRGHPAERRDF